MSTAPQTTFAGGRNPWPQLPGQAPKPALRAVKPAAAKSSKKRPTPKKIDLTNLVIVDDPLPPGHNATGAHKYHDLFDTLKPGQALKCEPDEAQALAKAMTNWLKRTSKEGQVTLCRDYPSDGKGRVWLLPAEKAEEQAGGK